MRHRLCFLFKISGYKFLNHIPHITYKNRVKLNAKLNLSATSVFFYNLRHRAARRPWRDRRLERGCGGQQVVGLPSQRSLRSQRRVDLRSTVFPDWRSWFEKFGIVVVQYAASNKVLFIVTLIENYCEIPFVELYTVFGAIVLAVRRYCVVLLNLPLYCQACTSQS